MAPAFRRALSHTHTHEYIYQLCTESRPIIYRLAGERVCRCFTVCTPCGTMLLLRVAHRHTIACTLARTHTAQHNRHDECKVKRWVLADWLAGCANTLARSRAHAISNAKTVQVVKCAAHKWINMLHHLCTSQRRQQLWAVDADSRLTRAWRIWGADNLMCRVRARLWFGRRTSRPLWLVHLVSI